MNLEIVVITEPRVDAVVVGGVVAVRARREYRAERDTRCAEFDRMVEPVGDAPIAVAVRFFSKRLRKVARGQQEAMGKMTQVLQEAIEAHKVVKIFGGQAFERERGDAENEMRRHAADVADFAQGRTANEVRGMMDGLAPALQAIGDGLAKLGDGQQAQAQATSALAQAVSAETELVRDPNTGRAIGARKKPPAMVM